MSTLHEKIEKLRKSNEQIEQIMEQARLNRQMGLLKIVQKKDKEILINQEIEELEEETNIVEIEMMADGNLKYNIKEKDKNDGQK